MMALTLNYGWRAPIALSLAVLALVVLPLTIFLTRDRPVMLDWSHWAARPVMRRPPP